MCYSDTIGLFQSNKIGVNEGREFCNRSMNSRKKTENCSLSNEEFIRIFNSNFFKYMNKM